MNREGLPEGRSPYAYLPAIRVAGDVVMKAGTGLGPRRIDDYELLYFPDGSGGLYQVEGKCYALSGPCFIVTRPGERHVYEYDPLLPSRHLFIHFDFQEGMVPPLSILSNGGTSCFPLASELPVGMMKQILHVIYISQGRQRERCGTLLLALLQEIEGSIKEQPQEMPSSQIPQPIVKAMDYIDKHMEGPISVEALANKVGWTHEHFSRSFVRYTGRTPREMIMHRRIDKACHLLLHEEWSIKEIAYAVGFSDENYFCRAFKTIKGMTALKYRKSYSNPIYHNLMPVSEGEALYPLNRILYNSEIK